MSRNKLCAYNETFCSAPPLVTSNVSSLGQRAMAGGLTLISKTIRPKKKRQCCLVHAIKQFGLSADISKDVQNISDS